MRGLITKIFLLTIAGIVSSAVQATDLKISGNVVASACTVDSGSVSQEIDFEQLRSTDLKQAGSSTAWKPFSVKLNSCPATTNVATVNFSGTAAADDATLFANSGTAKNIDVQLARDAERSVILSNGSSMAVTVDAQHNAVYYLAARLYTVTGDTVPGTFTSQVLMSFTYQ